MLKVETRSSIVSSPRNLPCRSWPLHRGERCSHPLSSLRLVPRASRTCGTRPGSAYDQPEVITDPRVGERVASVAASLEPRIARLTSDIRCRRLVKHGSNSGRGTGSSPHLHIRSTRHAPGWGYIAPYMPDSPAHLPLTWLPASRAA